MSTEIVTDICPPPEWNLTEGDIHQMVAELKSYYQDFKPAFEHRDQAAHGWVCLKGLLSDLPRKVTERIAGLTASPPSMPETEFDGLLSQLSNADLSKVLRIVASRLSG